MLEVSMLRHDDVTFQEPTTSPPQAVVLLQSAPSPELDPPQAASNAQQPMPSTAQRIRPLMALIFA
jgi:hypothetical protein